MIGLVNNAAEKLRKRFTKRCLQPFDEQGFVRQTAQKQRGKLWRQVTEGRHVGKIRSNRKTDRRPIHLHYAMGLGRTNIGCKTKKGSN